MLEANAKAPTQTKWRAIAAIMRLDKPIGAYLLAAPTAWALVIASEGWPETPILCIFALGVVITRAAGCTTNDLTDRDIDGHVERTRFRPLVSGALSVKEALFLLLTLLVIALVLVLQTNTLTVQLSFIGLGLTVIYPFMKRITYLPQVVLGAAFSWPVPMAFAAVLNELPTSLWWLFAANLIWTVVYDTQYAMVDREDDLKVGVKSTAILFGQLDRRIIAMLQVATLYCFFETGRAFGLAWPFYLAITAVGALFIRHQWLIRERDRGACFKAFDESKWIGVIVFIGLIATYAL